MWKRRIIANCTNVQLDLVVAARVEVRRRKVDARFRLVARGQRVAVQEEIPCEFCKEQAVATHGCLIHDLHFFLQALFGQETAQGLLLRRREVFRT